MAVVREDAREQIRAPLVGQVATFLTNPIFAIDETFFRVKGLAAVSETAFLAALTRRLPPPTHRSENVFRQELARLLFDGAAVGLPVARILQEMTIPAPTVLQ